MSTGQLMLGHICHSDSCRSDVLIEKSQNGGSVHIFIKYGLSRFGGGEHRVTVFLGGSRWDRPKMGGVGIRRPKGTKLVHTPPRMFMTPSLTEVTLPSCLFPNKPVNIVCRKFFMSQDIIRNLSKITELFYGYCVHSTLKLHNVEIVTIKLILS